MGTRKKLNKDNHPKNYKLYRRGLRKLRALCKKKFGKPLTHVMPKLLGDQFYYKMKRGLKPEEVEKINDYFGVDSDFWWPVTQTKLARKEKGAKKKQVTEDMTWLEELDF